MVAGRPIYRECRLGLGTVRDGTAGCVVEPSLRSRRTIGGPCSCRGECKKSKEKVSLWPAPVSHES